jgi:hypothetical protein
MMNPNYDLLALAFCGMLVVALLLVWAVSSVYYRLTDRIDELVKAHVSLVNDHNRLIDHHNQLAQVHNNFVDHCRPSVLPGDEWKPYQDYDGSEETTT